MWYIIDKEIVSRMLSISFIYLTLVITFAMNMNNLINILSSAKYRFCSRQLRIVGS